MKFTPLLITLSLCLVVLGTNRASANDGIFPPAPAAASAINFDGKGFIINGQRTFIASGGMEYARVPRALWRDRLLRMKRAGFNCTEMYLFWNFHEPQENKWNFSGDHDLNAYLQLVHQLGMYAIVRIGPYVCAEWDSGGYPVWLRFKPGLVVRADNQPFLDETFKYYDKIVPIVAANQINHGGSVILVQIENEDGDGWGTDSSLYEQKLRARVLADGIEVPTFFSGLHHGSDPAGNTPWDDATRANPWFSTEYWSVWYDRYGTSNPDFYTRGTWKILAFGGNGYNYYMLHGGTNFDFYNNNEDASSYDYGAGIGQAGDLRPTYYKFKEAAMFAHTFQSILENSVSSTAQYTGIAVNPAVREYARTGPDGTIIFLDNPSSTDLTTQVTGVNGTTEPAAGPAVVGEQKMLPVVENYALTPHFTIAQSMTQILTSVTNGSNTTLVVYGQPGSSGSLELKLGNVPKDHLAAISQLAGNGWTGSGGAGTLEFTYPATGVQSDILTDGYEKLQILVMGETLAQRTWEIPSAQGTDLVVGPDYVGNAALSGQKRTITAEFTTPQPMPTLDFLPNLSEVTMQPATPGEKSPAVVILRPVPEETMPDAPTLTNWQQKTVDESAATFDDSQWMTSIDPPYMGADGDSSAYAWYRTTINAAVAGTQYLLPASARDRMIVFVDGQRVPDNLVSTHSAQLSLSAGSHSLSILTAHYGRDKLVGYSGPINTIDAKGLGAPVVLSNIPKITLTSWQNFPATPDKPDVTKVPNTNDQRWLVSKLGTDIFNNAPGWAWYQTVVPAGTVPAGSSDLTVHFDCVDDNATVYCNGVQVGTHQGWNTGFDVDLKTAWQDGQVNVITVLDQNIDGGGGISRSITLQASSSGGTLTGWKFRGGIGDPTKISAWSPAPATPAPGPALPTFFQCHFTGTQPSGLGAYPILRVSVKSLSAGFVWLNGHNLGRYPEKIPIDGLYLPECWINNGDNQLIIFDEDGLSPANVHLYVEQPASRYDYVLSN